MQHYLRFCGFDEEDEGIGAEFPNQCIAEKKWKELVDKAEEDEKYSFEDANDEYTIRFKGYVEGKTCLCDTHDGCNDEELSPIDTGGSPSCQPYLGFIMALAAVIQHLI